MSDAPSDVSQPSAADFAQAQAEKYAQDLVALFAKEKAKRAELQLNNQKLEAIFDTTPNGLAIINHAMMIEEANPAFWSLTEQTDPEDKIPLKDILADENLLARLNDKDSQTAKVEVLLTISPSVHRTLLIDVARLGTGDNLSWVLSLNDLTERKRLESLKSEFINIAAHELRTPLAAILGFSQVLNDQLQGGGDDLSSHLSDTILKSSNRLKGIIDELIEFADVHYKKDGIHIESFNLIEVANEVVDNLRARIEDEALDLEIQYQDEDLEFTGTRKIIAEILTHLLENAIIYNKPDGHIALSVSHSADQIMIMVEDNGIGIPQAELSKIFDKFYQVEEHLTRSVGGLGLGLAIVQRGVNLHNGDIQVSSTLGEGSIFTITLPKVVATQTYELDQTLRTSHEQTLAYGKDLARAVASERKIAKRYETLQEQYAELCQAIFFDTPHSDLKMMVEDQRR